MSPKHRKTLTQAALDETLVNVAELLARADPGVRARLEQLLAAIRDFMVDIHGPVSVTEARVMLTALFLSDSLQSRYGEMAASVFRIWLAETAGMAVDPFTADGS